MNTLPFIFVLLGYFLIFGQVSESRRLNQRLSRLHPVSFRRVPFIYRTSRLGGGSRLIRIRPLKGSGVPSRFYLRPAKGTSRSTIVRVPVRKGGSTATVVQSPTRKRNNVILSPRRNRKTATKITRNTVNNHKNIKQTIILAKTANIMSSLGHQNAGPTGIVNKGKGNVQSRIPSKPNRQRQRPGTSNMGIPHGVGQPAHGIPVHGVGHAPGIPAHRTGHAPGITVSRFGHAPQGIPAHGTGHSAHGIPASGAGHAPQGIPTHGAGHAQGIPAHGSGHPAQGIPAVPEILPVSAFRSSPASLSHTLPPSSSNIGTGASQPVVPSQSSINANLGANTGISQLITDLLGGQGQQTTHGTGNPAHANLDANAVINQLAIDLLGGQGQQLSQGNINPGQQPAIGGHTGGPGGHAAPNSNAHTAGGAGSTPQNAGTGHSSINLQGGHGAANGFSNAELTEALAMILGYPSSTLGNSLPTSGSGTDRIVLNSNGNSLLVNGGGTNGQQDTITIRSAQNQQSNKNNGMALLALRALMGGEAELP